MSLALYRCGDRILLATSEQIVNEHLNRRQMRKVAVKKLPDGSLILHNNRPYDIRDLTKIMKKRARYGIDINKPFSVVIDDRFIK